MESPDREVVFNPRAHDFGQGDVDEDRRDGEEENRELDNIRRFDRGDNGRNRDNNRHFYMKPDSYSGNSDWEEYFSHFEDCVELGGLSDKDKVLTLAASLRGPARTFYISLSPAERRIYELLVNKLRQRFGCTRQQNRWLSRFESRKRLPGESIALLGDDLRQLSQKAYANLDARAQEALALNQLYKSISLEMKCRCIDKECETVCDAIQVIERYEGILGDPMEKKKTAVRNVSEFHTDSSEDDQLQDLSARIRKLEASNKVQYPSNQNYRNSVPPVQPPPRRSNFPNRSCYICESPDHYFRSCPIFKKCMQEMSSKPSTQNSKQTTFHGGKQQGNYKPSM